MRQRLAGLAGRGGEAPCRALPNGQRRYGGSGISGPGAAGAACTAPSNIDCGKRATKEIKDAFPVFEPQLMPPAANASTQHFFSGDQPW